VAVPCLPAQPHARGLAAGIHPCVSSPLHPPGPHSPAPPVSPLPPASLTPTVEGLSCGVLVLCLALPKPATCVCPLIPHPSSTHAALACMSLTDLMRLLLLVVCRVCARRHPHRGVRCSTPRHAAPAGTRRPPGVDGGRRRGRHGRRLGQQRARPAAGGQRQHQTPADDDGR
jgi:hypothetical protein